MQPPLSVAIIACPGCGARLAASLAAGLCPGCLGARNSGTPFARPGDLAPKLPRGFDYIETLGRGGMGEVFLVYQEALGRYVALKQLVSSGQHHARARERFVQEARASARLSHPHIVPMLEVSQDSEWVWFTMEYVEGGDLAQALAHRGTLPWREALGLVISIAEAIHYAHRLGVMHRDLKPSNILLTTDGKPKLADFGLAWVAGQELKELTATSEILGTPAYLAPEWISGSQRENDARLADIYSLGALLFHLIAGRPPFVREHPMQILAAIVNETAPDLVVVTKGAQVPRRVAQVCARCLAKRPADRYASAGELANVLRATLRSPTGVTPWLYHSPRIRRGLLASAGAFVLLGGALYFVRSPHLRPGAKALTTVVAFDPVVVMPLKAANPDDATILLAQGLQDELISALNRLTDLRVIAGDSARAAGKETENPQSLRSLLGVGAVLSGTVQKWQDTLRVAAQLTSTKDGTVLWSETYDRRETNLFNLQTDIATDVAVRLNVHLRGEVADAAGTTASGFPEAQRLLVKARALMMDASASFQQLDEAETLLMSATQVDPSFALAFAHLSQLHTLKYYWGNDRTERRLSLGLTAARAALRLRPGLPEAEIALGNFYFRGSRDYATARPHFERACLLAPHHPQAIEGLAHLERREGHFRQAAALFRSALELDPLNAILAYNTVDTFVRLRDYDVASSILEMALERIPRHVALIKLKGDLHVAWRGDLGAMREDLEYRDQKLPTPNLYVMDRIDWLILENRTSDALEVLRASPLQVLEGQSIFAVRAGYEALLLAIAGRPEEAQERAAVGWPDVQRELQLRPNDPRVLLHAGQIRMILGDIAGGDALIRRTLTAGDLAAVDAFDRGFFLRAHALSLALAGRDPAARSVVEQLLREPNQTSVAYLQLHPVLRNFAPDRN